MLDDARIFHVNVNCTDLARSHAFYTQALGLSEGVRTKPGTVQPGPAFGLERAQWDAWILVGDAGFQGGAIDLLQWIEPQPCGRVPDTMADSGAQRLGISVQDLDAVLARVEQHGGRITEPAHTSDVGGGHQPYLAHVQDPDGVRIELVQGPHTQVLFVGVCCADLEVSTGWYRYLGFQERVTFAIDGVGVGASGLDSPATIRERVLAAPGGGSVSMILVGFDKPPVRYTPSRPSNALGITRIALLLDDLDGAVERLRDLHIELVSEPVAMAMGEGLPELRFVCLRGPNHEWLELIEQPRTSTE